MLQRRRLARGRAPARKVSTRRVPKAGTRILHGLRWGSLSIRCPRRAFFSPGPGPFSSCIGGRKGLQTGVTDMGSLDIAGPQSHSGLQDRPLSIFAKRQAGQSPKEEDTQTSRYCRHCLVPYT